MKYKDMEQGVRYIGSHGQIREIVKMDGVHLTYRQISLGQADPAVWPEEGEERTIKRNSFVTWAKSVVEE